VKDDVDAAADVPTLPLVHIMELGMLVFGAATILLVLELVVPGEKRVSLWIVEVPFLWIVYLSGVAGAALMGIGYLSRFLHAERQSQKGQNGE
jgi:hypothetical protein